MRQLSLYEWVVPAYDFSRGRPSLAALVLIEWHQWQRLQDKWESNASHEEWERARVVWNSDADATNTLTIRRFLDHGIPMCL